MNSLDYNSNSKLVFHPQCWMVDVINVADERNYILVNINYGEYINPREFIMRREEFEEKLQFILPFLNSE